MPYTRGREKSRHPEDILDEIAGLAADGVKEVTSAGAEREFIQRDRRDGTSVGFCRPHIQDRWYIGHPADKVHDIPSKGLV